MNDDEQWLQALAGQTQPDASAATRQEAALLRQALQRWPVPAPPLQPSADDEERLVAAARAAGLLAPRQGFCPGCLRRWQQAAATLAARPAWPAAALAAGVAVLMLNSSLPDLQPPDGDAPALRAPTAGGVQLRQAADPLAARDALADRLAALQVPVQRYPRLGRYGLDAELPPVPSAALAQLLRDEGLAAAPDHSLRVEFSHAP